MNQLYLFYAGMLFATYPTWETKGMCGTPGGPVSPLNPAAACLGGWEELQPRRLWSPPAVPDGRDIVDYAVFVVV